MAVPIRLSADSGSTLFATLQRLSDGFWWNQSATAWQANPAASDRRVPLTEGTGAYTRQFTGSAAGLGDAGFVFINVHDDGDADDAVVSGGQTYVSGDNEVGGPELTALLLGVNVAAVNGVTLQGTGVLGDEWRPD